MCLLIALHGCRAGRCHLGDALLATELQTLAAGGSEALVGDAGRRRSPAVTARRPSPAFTRRHAGVAETGSKSGRRLVR